MFFQIINSRKVGFTKVTLNTNILIFNSDRVIQGKIEINPILKMLDLDFEMFLIVFKAIVCLHVSFQFKSRDKPSSALVATKGSLLMNLYMLFQQYGSMESLVT